VRTEIKIANEDAAGNSYLTWAPVGATIRLVEPEGPEAVDVMLTNADPLKGGQVVFGIARHQPLAATLTLTLPADGSEVEFFIAGEYPKFSSSAGDAGIRSALVTGTDLSTKAVMVRVRRNANALEPSERERFTTALAILNDQGAGAFKDFRAMHREQLALAQAHGAPGFLSWHRAYLLDLERELQQIDSSVALPYWRFDQPAPNLFTPDFMGQSAGPLGSVRFSPTNLLRQWQTDGAVGILRSPLFDVRLDPASVSDQAATLLLGGSRPNAVFDIGPAGGGFDEMEGDPHGLAHTSFSGWIRSPATAPRDPVFFLLHCNVDRLWALWQWYNERFDGSQSDTYFYRGLAGSPGATIVGHNLGDTMWPWNNVTGGSRPMNAPRTPFPAVPTANAPRAAPTVGDMIDYQGILDPNSIMGYAYDDVPFGVAP
jgi:tyrosinase